MSAQLWISDASPLFFYSPAPAYFSGQQLSSWVGSDSGGGGAAGGTATSHSATGSAAVILPAFYATSFSPIFTAPESYNVTLRQNSLEPEVWASGQNWTAESDSFDPQTFEIDFSCSSDDCGNAIFQGAWVTTQLAPNGSDIDTVKVDDASPLVVYSGFAPVGTDNEVVQTSGADYNGSLSMSSTAGATAQVMFTGASISIAGVTCPSCSTYTILLDGTTAATLDAANNATIHGALLYFTTNLDTSTSHTVVVQAVGGGLVIDSFEVNGPKGGAGFIGNIGGSTTTLGPGGATGTGNSSATGTGGSDIGATQGGSPNAGVIVGAVLGSLAGVGFLWYLCRKVAPAAKAAAEKKMNPWDEANLLQNMKNEEVHVTTAANQRYVYPGLIAHSDLKKK
ncbi:hypothetical protein IAT38_004677 [Cryptococcus sp. DSM 104549]